MAATSSYRRSFGPMVVPRSLSHIAPAPRSVSVRFCIEGPISPKQSIATVKERNGHVDQVNRQKRTCMCSPTNHPGSFRCSLHKKCGSSEKSAVPYTSNRLSARRSAMTNSLIRIGTVEGDMIKRGLAALIRPSSHQQRRRAGFQPRPSRFSVIARARVS